MPIRDIIATTGSSPATITSLVDDLSALGVRQEMTVLVHSSLSKLGYVCGGPVAVVLALQQCLGEEGTLVMPAHSSDLSDPAQWENPPVPESWWHTIRSEMPAYRPDMTPAHRMGAIADCFRTQNGVLRSRHPHVSFAARGPRAADIVKHHAYAYGLGDDSPLARLYDCDAWVLLLGTGHATNTSLHLAEYRAEYRAKREVTMGAPVFVDGRREWITFPDVDLDVSDFKQIGAAFEEQTGLVRRGRIGEAEAQFMPQRPLVDFAVDWMERNRQRAR